MQLVLHAGVHFTEDERLLRCLLRNVDEFAQRGIAVPGPGTYRALIRDTLNAMHKTPASPEAREVLLDAILDDAPAERVILSDANFFRIPSTAMQEGMLYPAAPVRMMRMSQLFPDDRIELFFAIRNPATLLPVLLQEARDKSDAAFWGDRRPQDVRWSETIAQIRETAPDIPITVWCNEDAPLIWSHILREVAGIGFEEKLTGGFDLLSSIMSKEGMERFRSYLAAHPDISEVQKRRIIAAFLDKFALDEEIEEELDMPGWTEELVTELSELYDEDLLAIQRIPGVTVLTP